MTEKKTKTENDLADGVIFNGTYNLIDFEDMEVIAEKSINALGFSNLSFTAEQAVEALCSLASFGYSYSDSKTKHYISGLGEVYNLIRDFFENDKIKYLCKKLEYFLHKKSNILTQFFKRRTTKTTLHPVRLKGWKQRR